MSCSEIHLFFCGDIMPGGMFPYQSKFIDDGLLSFMASFDLRVGTLEAAIGTDIPFDEIKMKHRCNIVFARDEDLFRVATMGMNVLSLANNHIYDLGEKGLINTLNKLNSLGIAHCGAGITIAEARKPAIVFLRGKKIAFLAACSPDPNQVGTLKVATESEPGVNPIDETNLLADIEEAKHNNDFVIVLPHWGVEHNFLPLPSIVSLSKKLIDAGADAIFGSHTHLAQPFIYYKNKPVFFGLGNYLFPDYYMQPPRPMWYPKVNEIIPCFERVIGYPFPINEPKIHVWPQTARVGIIVDCILSDRIKTNIHFSLLNNDNIVLLKNNKTLRRKIYFSQSFVFSPILIRLYNAVMKRIKKLFTK